MLLPGRVLGSRPCFRGDQKAAGFEQLLAIPNRESHSTHLQLHWKHRLLNRASLVSFHRIPEFHFVCPRTSCCFHLRHNPCDGSQFQEILKEEANC